MADEKKSVRDLLDPDSDDFLGTGMNMEEYLKKLNVEMISRSYVTQHKNEKQRRLKYIIELSAELQKIEAIAIHGTRQGEIAIEAIMEGDWRAVKDWALHFTFKGEDERMQKEYVPLWANFVKILTNAYETNPEQRIHSTMQ